MRKFTFSLWKKASAIALIGGGAGDKANDVWRSDDGTNWENLLHKQALHERSISLTFK